MVTLIPGNHGELAMPKPFAIVTAASKGIGLELARIAALEHYEVLITADEPQIEQAAAELRSIGADVRAIEADLATSEGLNRLLRAMAGRPLDVLCLNTSMGMDGPFLDQPVSQWRRTVDANVTGTLYLLQVALREMVDRDQGRVLVTGSISGFVPDSHNAVHNGTKALIDSVTESIRNELEDISDVTLTTLMPGATEAELMARAGLMNSRAGQQQQADPAAIAREGWRALMAGERHVVSGWKRNRAEVAMSDLVSSSVSGHRRHH